ncbi:MAG: CpaF family protein [bacterium]
MSLRDRLSKNLPPSKSSDVKPYNELSLYNEPLTVEFMNIKEKIHTLLIEKVNSTPVWDTYSEEEQKQFIRQFIDKKLSSDFGTTPLNKNEKEIIIREILNEVKGYGPLDILLADTEVSDILVNGAKQVYVEKHGKIHKTSITFKDNAHLMNIIERIVSKVGRRIDEKSPMVDARLPDGSRVNAIIPPLAIDGPSLSIRRFKSDVATLESLLQWGSMTTAMADTLKAAVKSRLNIVISGGTGAGKTTLLNSLSAQIPEDERIVTIEDSAELNLQQEHVVRLETRPSNIEGTGAITARDLVINALRMRPDRIVIGECRGAETLDMLQAMNTGHDGSLTTLHANTPRDALSRLETMVMFSGVELPERTIRTQVSSAVHIIVQASRLSDGTRRVTHITELTGLEGSTITMQDIFKWEQTGIDENGKIIGQHVATGVRPLFADRCKSKGINLSLAIFDAKTPPVYLCKNPPNLKTTKEVTSNNNSQNNNTKVKNEELFKSSNESNSLLNRLKR